MQNGKNNKHTISQQEEAELLANQEAMVNKKHPHHNVHNRTNLLGKDKTYYDSATQNQKLDRDRAQDQKIQKEMYDQMKKIEAHHGTHLKKNPHNLLGEDKNKGKQFDSAEWALQLERDRHTKEQ